MDLCVGVSPLRDSDVPETLQIDVERFTRIRSDLACFTVVGATLVTAKNLLRRDLRSQWKPEAKRICDSIKEHGYENSDGNLAARILAIIESSKGMPQSSREHLSSVIGRFLLEMKNGSVADPVLKLLQQRLRMHIFNRLAASTSAERVRVASTASEGLAGIGLSEFIGQVGAIAGDLGKVATIDQGAHGEWYRAIADELDRMGAVET